MDVNKQIEEITSQYTQDRNTMKIERVAAYVRVSTQEQKLHGISLDAQRAKLTEYAEKNKMRIVEWYVDEGVSGRKLIRNRPELQRMIQDAEKGRFDRIIFIKLDRFFRSVAEYHECMKRIAPVVWSATEEEYDLTTPNGRMLVNMKITIAEMEADQTGERIKIVNEYKVQTGQPLGGKQALPFGFKVGKNELTGRKSLVHDEEEDEILMDAINHYLTHQSKHKTLIYLNAKHSISMSYKSFSNLLSNTLLYGQYRDNPSYCEPYITKETFDRIQEIAQRNVRNNTKAERTYIFSGLIKCPLCGRTLKGNTYHQKYKGTTTIYKKYRCCKNKVDGNCSFNKVVAENPFERLMLENIQDLLEQAKIESATISDTETVNMVDIDDIHDRIDRLNYSWQTGKIRKVEKYEADYAALMEELEAAEAAQNQVTIKDFSKVEKALEGGWKEIYNKLDDAHKLAFWRSFIRSIEIDWTTERKKITRVNFF